MTREDRPKLPKNRCPLTGSDRLRAAANQKTEAIKDAFPAGIAQPALRALAAAGYTRLDELRGMAKADLLKLHGMGPKAVGLIMAALKEGGRRGGESKLRSHRGRLRGAGKAHRGRAQAGCRGKVGCKGGAQSHERTGRLVRAESGVSVHP